MALAPIRGGFVKNLGPEEARSSPGGVRFLGLFDLQTPLFTLVKWPVKSRFRFGMTLGGDKWVPKLAIMTSYTQHVHMHKQCTMHTQIQRSHT